ncbi:hypothetical protein ACFVAD_20425 [Sutcliffiella sp. NPDC057660]|uniref:hypothetical protein n=1 Tax=Sutcliffiella sp. NPDC057660 TaxID=3346199 RepID=UPI0036A9EBF8
MNVTLEVSLLGEETLKRKISVSFHYFLASTISGSISGFLYTSMIFVVLSWIPFSIKGGIFSILLFVYTLDAFKLIKIKLPENKWQIPSEWFKGSTIQNMWVWGLILGAGMFTYMPYATFYILYIYIGLFMNPIYGFAFGFVYAFSRALPTVIVLLSSKKVEMKDVKRLYVNKTNTFLYLNGLTLLVTSCIFILLLFKTI